MIRSFLELARTELAPQRLAGRNFLPALMPIVSQVQVIYVPGHSLKVT